MAGTYRDPQSDNDATNPLNDAPSGGTIVSGQDGHVPLASGVYDFETGEQSRNKREC